MRKDFKLEKKYVECWDFDDIISCAVSQGMGFQAEGIRTEELEYNKKILVKVLKEKNV